MNIYYAIILSVLFALTAIAFVFRKRMDAYVQARSKLVRNEQAKLFATAMNNIGVALIVGGVALPIFQGHFELDNVWTKGGFLSLCAWLIGGGLLFFAQLVISKMEE